MQLSIVISIIMQLYNSNTIQLSHNIMRPCIDGEVEYGQELFEFQDGRTITCKTIYATDDRVSDGTQTSRLIIDAQRLTTVPFEIFPQSIPITIIDNDGE